ncbi:MAG: hypothetical protein ACREVV_05170 [Steroidobacteraceae bacterium]
MNAWLPRGATQWTALPIAVLALLACLLLGFASPQQGLLSYLFAFVFFTGLSLGSLALLMVHALTGGAWGDYLRPQLLAAARILPLQAVLVLPILFGLHLLYPWARADLLSHDSLLRAQSWYLDPTFFVIRTIAYFAVWLSLLVVIGRWAGNPARAAALPRIAAPGLIVYALSTFLAATDWAMSLLPHWHSSTFGMMVATGWMLSAAALAVLRAVSAADSTEAHSPHLFPDLGNLLLMFVLAWSYLAFMQYLTIWIADLPAETAWYIPRTLTSWRALAWFLIAFHFAVPFAVLLSRRAKQRKAWLGWIAALLLLANLADALWLIVPNFRAQGFALRWTDLFAAVGIGALWWTFYPGQLRTARMPAGSMRSTPEHFGGAHG